MIFTREESALLDAIAIEDALAGLDPVDRTLVELRYGYVVPEWSAGPELAKIGRYLPRLHPRAALSAQRVQQRIARVLRRWRERYHDAPQVECEARSQDPGAKIVSLRRESHPLRRAA